jgi:hypothetical protein
VRVVGDTTEQASLAQYIASCAASWKVPPPSDGDAQVDFDIDVPATVGKGPLGPRECAMSSAIQESTKDLFRCAMSRQLASGGIIFRVRFDERGKAAAVRAVRDTIGNRDVSQCMTRALERLTVSNDSGHDMFSGVTCQLVPTTKGVKLFLSVP